MSPTPDPSQTMTIRDLTPTITTFSTPFTRSGIIKVGSRATLVKLATGSLAIFSPVALTPEVKTKVSSQGQLKYIIAPDYEHHLSVSAWSKEYPAAQIIGVEGLPEKRAKNKSTAGTKFAFVFTLKNKLTLQLPSEFTDEFDHEYFHSHVNKELVFLHRPTRTLIEADLVWNLPAVEQYAKSDEDPRAGLLTKFATAVFNMRGDMTAQKRFLWYFGCGFDRRGFAESVRRIEGWDFDRVIPCHGDVIETGGKKAVGQLMSWFREMK